ncbi:ShKT domain-containing protein [Caenorhabditis elegans]|uniref:ShKT domain-containing protein n=1 Tax=Caenorhabditis elegans TaxID=6239 RepID=O16424_CAEEL|nr:ShKT domain-containing protein [Caenorhabditis elegans]CCD70828.1 ShKT domain-containing protein [Caenorhabditis elegans]|eukprot:NP_504152.1 PHAryngeal gland Toxin-related [Caenorhabditis elegans]
MYFLISLFFVPFSSAVIGGDLNCTTYNGTAFVYTPSATACSNSISDSSCAALYPPADAAIGYPAAGNDAERPFACYTTATPTPAPVVADMKTAALANCAKTCGFCCSTDAYNCPNVAFPRLNCNTITKAQCDSVTWRTIIAADCPSACGFCNQGGCVDAVTNCGNDLSICQTVGMQDFVNQYCQRTCGRCPSTTGSGTVTTASSGSCTSFAADSSSSCSAWAANGFCTNTFYTAAQRKSRCATSCRLC